MPTLYEHPLSPYAQKVKIALYEKGIAFQAVTPDIFGEGTPDFVASNPRREVPSLVDDDGTSVFDSTIILEYIEDKWSTPALLPKSPAERARLRMLEELCDTYYEAINWGLAEIHVFGRAKGDLATEMTARAAEQIAGMHRRLERELQNRSWFNGDSFGWGDLSAFPYVAGSANFGVAPAAGSALQGWLARALERDSIQQCNKAAVEAMSGFQNLGAIVEQGLFVREYRDHRLEWMMRSGGTQIVLDGMAKKNIRFAAELS
jgi:glutathione S-transferase/RNA polymerase-associated protein